MAELYPCEAEWTSGNRHLLAFTWGFSIIPRLYRPLFGNSPVFSIGRRDSKDDAIVTVPPRLFAEPVAMVM